MRWLAVLLFGASTFNSIAAGLYPEYNTWYYQNGVLYDMTQTSASEPVLISISMAGYASANMVVSLVSDDTCAASAVKNQLMVNGESIPANYHCVFLQKGTIEHFSIEDAIQVNKIVNYLRSDFTIILQGDIKQGDIKVWAANIKNPRYGLAPGL
jgi:hypothetical protein